MDDAPTSDLEALEDQERAERIMAEIREATAWSFKVRPMVATTKAEARRRLDIAWLIWRELVHTGGYDPLNAARSVPSLLVEHLDRAPPEGMEALIAPVFETKLIPLDGGRSRVTPERALSALAVNRGRMLTTGPAIIIPGDRRRKP
ncbi:MAG: hypothetical protein KJ977_05315 [Candidatus Omnitrophica bacterium]|nr:hypothetical protein [Candidatus Omnitrophota bacterium]